MALTGQTRVIRADEVATAATLVVVPHDGATPSLMIPGVTADMASQVAVAARDPLADLKLHAQAIRDEAEAEALALRTRAEQESQRIRQQAREDGFSQGLEAAKRQVREDLGGLLKALAVTVDELNAYRTDLVEHHREEALKLAMAMAERVLRTHIERDPVLLSTMLNEVLRPVQPLVGLTIRVHANDAPLLEDCRHQLERDLGTPSLQIVTDRNLSPGSLRCQFEGGDVDASLNTQLIRLQTAISQQLIRDVAE